MFFLRLIFILFIIEAVRIAGRIIKKKRSGRLKGDPITKDLGAGYWYHYSLEKKGGKPIKYFNGRFFW